jgi:endo-1,4-beta-xylanase
MRPSIWKLSVLTVLLSALAARGGSMSLKDKFKDDFYIGAAFGNDVFSEERQTTLALIAGQFSSITACNELKWRPFQPKPDAYHHEPADRFVEFGEKNGMYVVGHVLFWHEQTPDWVFEGAGGKPASRELLLQRMRERVRHVAARYKGRIDAWDVVNEAFLDDGSMRDSKWTQIVGDDFIEQAFRIAGEELPADVDLIYNDYSMTAEGRRDAVVRMVKDFKKKGIRIDGVGMQGHWALNDPAPGAIEASIIAFSKAGVDVHITELDVDVLPRDSKMWSGNADIKLQLQQDPKMDPYRAGLPEDMQKKLADRYADIFKVFMRHKDMIKRVTFWGPTDRYSWLNHWPIKGRTNYPLLFDREGRPKPAYDAVVNLVND